MGMNVGQDGGGEDEVNSSINTTPLVDVMLVLLIIFLITIPVVLHDVHVELPKERNQARKTRPENITISVSKEGDVYWGQELMTDNEKIVERLKKEAVKDPQPEVHIRGDMGARYESIGRVVFDCQRSSIVKVSFVLEPPPNGG
jgi:biopolymer transport protein ExbD